MLKRTLNIALGVGVIASFTTAMHQLGEVEKLLIRDHANILKLIAEVANRQSGVDSEERPRVRVVPGPGGHGYALAEVDSGADQPPSDLQTAKRDAWS